MRQISLTTIYQVEPQDIITTAQAVGHTSMSVLEKWQHLAEQDLLTMVAAKVNGKVVGTGNIQWNGAEEKEICDEIGNVPELNAGGVLEAYRKRGIGGALLDERERLAQARGHSEVCLAVEVENDTARRVFEHHGYVYKTVQEKLTFWTSWPEVDESGDEQIYRAECMLMVKELD